MNKKYLIRKHEISIPELIGIGECRVLDSYYFDSYYFQFVHLNAHLDLREGFIDEILFTYLECITLLRHCRTAFIERSIHRFLSGKLRRSIYKT